MPWLTPNSSAPTDVICRRVVIPNDVQYIEAVSGALLELTYVSNWEQFGATTPDYVAGVMSEVFQSYAESSLTCMIGMIVPYATIAPPAGCLPCDGSVHSAADWPRLWAILSPVYKTGIDTFTTPDLRRRVPVGAGGSWAVGDTGGAETVALTVDQLARHGHTNQPHDHTYDRAFANIDLEQVGVPDVAALGLPFIPTQTNLTSIIIDETGADEPHENMPPFVALNYCIVAR